jgi:hypothetical protein
MGFSSKKTTSKTTVTPTNPDWVEPQLNTLAGKITDLSKMDPYGFVAGANNLQKQAFDAAGGLGGADPNYGSAQGLFQAQMNTGTSPYDPATVKPNSILPNLQSYMSPYLQQVLDSSLADYDFGAGQTRAQNKLALAADETFGGSGGAIQTAMSEDALARGRGTLSSQLRDQAFQTGANLASLDADRRQQAQLANMAAYNQARQFNATQVESALARQRQAAGGLVDSTNTQHQSELGDINTQAALGEAWRQIQQQQASAPLSTLGSLVGAYGGLPLNLLHGQVTDSKTKETGSVLDALTQMAGIASTLYGGGDIMSKLPKFGS